MPGVEHPRLTAERLDCAPADREAGPVSLTRFWFDFLISERAPSPFDEDDVREIQDNEPSDHPLSAGAGVTAFDEQDALSLLRDRVGTPLPPVIQRFTDLEADRHALQIDGAGRVGNAAWRGVWFPAPGGATRQD